MVYLSEISNLALRLSRGWDIFGEGGSGIFSGSGGVGYFRGGGVGDVVVILTLIPHIRFSGQNSS